MRHFQLFWHRPRRMDRLPDCWVHRCVFVDLDRPRGTAPHGVRTEPDIPRPEPRPSRIHRPAWEQVEHEDRRTTISELASEAHTVTPRFCLGSIHHAARLRVALGFPSCDAANPSRLPVGPEDGAVLHDPEQHRQRAHPAAFLGAVDPAQVNVGTVAARLVSCLR
jgi:hypothetical protein